MYTVLLGTLSSILPMTMTIKYCRNDVKSVFALLKGKFRCLVISIFLIVHQIGLIISAYLFFKKN